MVLFYFMLHLDIRGTFPNMFIDHLSLFSCELHEFYIFQEYMIVIYHVYCKYFPYFMLFNFIMFENAQHSNKARNIEISMLLFKHQTFLKNQERFKLLKGLLVIQLSSVRFSRAVMSNSLLVIN